jgi:hypothetical protein
MPWDVTQKLNVMENVKNVFDWFVSVENIFFTLLVVDCKKVEY